MQEKQCLVSIWEKKVFFFLLFVFLKFLLIKILIDLVFLIKK